MAVALFFPFQKTTSGFSNAPHRQYPCFRHTPGLLGVQSAYTLPRPVQKEVCHHKDFPWVLPPLIFCERQKRPLAEREVFGGNLLIIAFFLCPKLALREIRRAGGGQRSQKAFARFNHNIIKISKRSGGVYVDKPCMDIFLKIKKRILSGKLNLKVISMYKITILVIDAARNYWKARKIKIQ